MINVVNDCHLVRGAGLGHHEVVEVQPEKYWTVIATTEGGAVTLGKTTRSITTFQHNTTQQSSTPT